MSELGVLRLRVRRAMIPLAVMAMLSVGALAADPETSASSSETIKTAFTTGFTSVVADATALIAAAVPIALGLAGTIFLVRKAMSWFKSVAK